MSEKRPKEERADSRRSPASSRRDFLTGRALKKQAEFAGEQIADALTSKNETEGSDANQQWELSDFAKLETRAMACNFAVFFAPLLKEKIWDISEVLDYVQVIEEQLTVYRDSSELQLLNTIAFEKPFFVKQNLFDLLQQACLIEQETDGAYNPVSGSLIKTWKAARNEKRIPTQQEIEVALNQSQTKNVLFDSENCAIRFSQPNMQFDLGGIGKGYALDVLGEKLSHIPLENWLIHGGQSSLLAQGGHGHYEGWPVDIRHPSLPKERFATILLQNKGFSASGTAVQNFRHAGKRYGHIIDPKTGMPAESMLSVAVVAPTSALADALSTAFFVLGLEKTTEYCDNHPDIGAILIRSPPERQLKGRLLEPILLNCESIPIQFH